MAIIGTTKKASKSSTGGVISTAIRALVVMRLPSYCAALTSSHRVVQV